MAEELKSFIGMRVCPETKGILQKEADRKYRGNLSALLENILESKAKQIKKRGSNGRK